MNKTDYERVKHLRPGESLACAARLVNQTDRTLLYGYTCERESFHVYLENGVLVRVIYNHARLLLDVVSGAALAVGRLIPDKRLYPEACCAEFCTLLVEQGHHLPFTTFNDERDLSVQFQGKRLSELCCIPAEQLKIPVQKADMKGLRLEFTGEDNLSIQAAHPATSWSSVKRPSCLPAEFLGLECNASPPRATRGGRR